MDPKEASTIKRIAGNIAGRLIPEHVYDQKDVAREAVDLAIAINEEVNRRIKRQAEHERIEPPQHSSVADKLQAETLRRLNSTGAR